MTMYEKTISFDTTKATFHPGITTLWARQRVEDLMDHWRQADRKPDKREIRQSIITHAIRYHLVTKFTSLVAVEQMVVNPSGQSNKAPVPTELPEGMVMDKVFGAPATGTTDSFFEAAGHHDSVHGRIGGVRYSAGRVQGRWYESTAAVAALVSDRGNLSHMSRSVSPCEGGAGGDPDPPRVEAEC